MNENLKSSIEDFMQADKTIEENELKIEQLHHSNKLRRRYREEAQVIIADLHDGDFYTLPHLVGFSQFIDEGNVYTLLYHKGKLTKIVRLKIPTHTKQAPHQKESWYEHYDRHTGYRNSEK